MPFQTNLFFNISSGRFVLSATAAVDLPSLAWVFGDTKNLLIQFVKNLDSPGRVSVLPSAGIGLQVAVGPRGTSWASATAGAAIGDAFPVSLPLVGSGLTGALTGEFVDTQLELKTTSGGLYERYQVPLRIYQRVSADVLPDPPAADPAIGRADATATFWPRNAVAGDYQIWRSASGLVAKVYLGDDGTVKADPLA